jgi:hypothetical protein
LFFREASPFKSMGKLLKEGRKGSSGVGAYGELCGKRCIVKQLPEIKKTSGNPEGLR